MSSAEQGGANQTVLTLKVDGNFAGYSCVLEGAFGGEAGLRARGQIDLRNDTIATFLRNTGLVTEPEARNFPPLVLPSPTFEYRARPETLAVTFTTEIDFGPENRKLGLAFGYSKIGGNGLGSDPASRHVGGVLATTPLSLRTLGGTKDGIIGQLIGDLEISHIGVFYASESITAADGLAILGGKDATQQGFAAGLSFSARFGIRDSFTDVALPPPSKPSIDGTRTPKSDATAAQPGQAVTDPRMRAWFKVDKTFGPLQIRRIGGEWDNGKLGFLLDAGVELLGLKVGLAGLRVSVPPAKLTKLELSDFEFGLDGLEVGFTGGPVTISGAFLKTPDGSYAGMALIRVPMFTLSAIGAYGLTPIDKQPSLFIFGAFVGIIGGDPCFVIEGLAAGFGYNRGLTIPEIDKVRDFPLVSLVLGSAPGGSTQSDSSPSMLEQLGGSHFPIMQGQYWLAAGIKFSSYKLIDAFALVTVQFGLRFELALLGIATIQQPPKIAGASVPPFVFVEMAMSLRFAPDDGLFAVQAQLTSNSYLFDPQCKLTGGFAFCIWFAPTNPRIEGHAGDFVLTFGGYHPRFKAPAHYPKVPRIGIDWQRPELGITIKGECYFALTPSCIMGGLRLMASYQASLGDALTVHVWFEAHADFVMAWEPFHYEAEVGIWIGASVTLHIGDIAVGFSFQLGASLSIWGPEFAGEARIELGIVSFTVPIGDRDVPRTPPPLTWGAFRDKFIPRIDNKPTPLGIVISAGILREDKNQGVTIVNPGELSLVVDSYIPVTTLSVNGQPPGAGSKDLVTNFGIRPLSEETISSDLLVTVKGGRSGGDVPMHSCALSKGVAEALWSRSPGPSALGNDPIEANVIQNAQSGVRLSAPAMRQPRPADAKRDIETVRKRMAQPGLEKPSRAKPTADARTKLRTELAGTAERRKQTVGHLQRLGFELAPDLVDIQEVAPFVMQPDVLVAPPAFVALGDLPPERQGQ